jgi:hypothetical protein
MFCYKLLRLLQCINKLTGYNGIRRRSLGREVVRIKIF